MDLEEKKTFLLEGSKLYQAMIDLAPSDTLRRYLAFRIIVNAMSFEDLVRNRQFKRMRIIRNVLLAHKQEGDFTEGLLAINDVTRVAVAPLLSFMANETPKPVQAWLLPELSRGTKAATQFSSVVPQILRQYEANWHSGHRLINNFLCFTGSDVKEIGKGAIPEVFYRYNSSKALFILGEALFNNCRSIPELTWLARHAKLDMILHAQNMADCIFKDQNNSHSIDGLFEVMTAENIGDPKPLQAVNADQTYQGDYLKVRNVRNKLIGHIDTAGKFTDLITALDQLPVQTVFNVYNTVDKAVQQIALSTPVIKIRYQAGNQKLSGAVALTKAFEPVPY